MIKLKDILKYILNENMPIDDGVKIDRRNNNIYFDFKHDDPNPKQNVMNLLPRESGKELLDHNGMKYYIGYNIRVGGNDLYDIRKAIKIVNNPKLKQVSSRGKIQAEANEVAIKLIDNALDRFSSLPTCNLDTFDLIITAPSSSKLNSLIAERIKLRVRNKDIVKTDVFVKGTIMDITFDVTKYNKMSNVTKDDIMKYIRAMYNPQYIKDKKSLDMTYAIKMMGHHKQLVSGYIKFAKKFRNDLQFIKKHLSNARILFIDDTVGTKATLRDMRREISPYKPKEIYLFALLNDHAVKK